MGKKKADSSAVVDNRRTEENQQGKASGELADVLAKPDVTDELVRKAARGNLSRLRSGYGRKGTFLVGDAFGNTLGG